jgi:hydroxymethylglutaryl-CoA reductase
MTVNGKDRVVPMVLEEPSVVAAVGNVARMTRPEGFTATSDDPVMVAVLFLPPCAAPAAALGPADSWPSAPLPCCCRRGTRARG